MAQKPVYLDEGLSFEERAKDLVSRMTLEEKTSQMLHSSAAIPRLGIPSYNWWGEALHGIARAGVATMFPQAIAMAATFCEDLILKQQISYQQKVGQNSTSFNARETMAYTRA